MKRLSVAILLIGLLLAGLARAQETEGREKERKAPAILKMILPSQVEIGGRLTTYDGGEASGFALNGIYDLATASRAIPRYLGIAFEQLSDTDANLKTMGRFELLWEPYHREIFGVVFGAGGSGENFSVENADWGWHYGGGVTLELGSMGKLIVTYRNQNLRVAEGSIGAGVVAKTPF